jgi:hypothetical protein
MSRILLSAAALAPLPAWAHAGAAHIHPEVAAIIALLALLPAVAWYRRLRRASCHR